MRQETRHQMLQRALAERKSGGPHEQTRSKAFRLQATRSCEVSHSSLEEPLTHWKSLESLKPQWPHSIRRYHKDHGIRVVDNDTVVISARDQVQKTPNGLIRSSSGSVTYSHTQRQKAEIEVQELAHILSDGPPSGSPGWTPKKLEWIFKERAGRPGVWGHYNIGIKAFLLCFPKTFEMYGNGQEFVRLRRARNTIVLDDAEEAMTRLARARWHGYIQQQPMMPGKVTNPLVELVHKDEDGRVMKKEINPLLQLPTLTTNRLKVAFLPYETGGGRFGSFGD